MAHDTIQAGLAPARARPWTASIHELAARWRDRAQRRAVYLRTVRELNGCSDRDLADLSIARSDIPRIAAEAAGRAGGLQR